MTEMKNENNTEATEQQAEVKVKVFGVFDDKGMPVSFHTSDDPKGVPDNAVQISDADFYEFVTYPGFRKWGESGIEVIVQKYGVFDADGRPTAFYSSDVHNTVPENAIPISDDDWSDMVSNPGFRKMGKKGIEQCEPRKLVLTWKQIERQQRDLLAASDFRMLPDYPATEEQRAAWVAYRHELRQVNNIYKKPEDVVWPTQPV